MSARSALAAGALVAVSFTGLAIAVGGSANAATPHTSSAVGVVSAAATTTTDTAAPKLGWRWWAGLSSDQQQCLAKAGLTRPAFPLTDAEKAAVQAAVRDAAQGCGITLPTGERAAALRTWWEGLTDDQRTELLYWLKEGSLPFDVTYTFERPVMGTYDMVVMGTDTDADALFPGLGCSPAIGRLRWRACACWRRARRPRPCPS